ncbi:hypothetical protein IscW_ISCW020993 [Ixodes scapularis]|uniref:Uncharacterized protein n=1 Tax=Ixodes scapularis TaxID=6945 RepID=B7Q5T4_IXOSC|nr:hypothetical protein IscW_ISCW020993 [Ixodes scapularis]|eukprot:XP_002402233.1 hypothetical protein IscW_ISCW020993 [Ixodes scapularis]
MIDGQGELLSFQLLGEKNKDVSSTRFRTGDFEYQSMRVKGSTGSEYQRTPASLNVRYAWFLDFLSARFAAEQNYGGTSVCRIYVRRDLIGIAAADCGPEASGLPTSHSTGAARSPVAESAGCISGDPAVHILRQPGIAGVLEGAPQQPGPRSMERPYVSVVGNVFPYPRSLLRFLFERGKASLADPRH